MAAIRAILAEDIDVEREVDPRAYFRRSIRDPMGVTRRRSFFLPVLGDQVHEDEAAVRLPRLRSDLMPATVQALDGIFAKLCAVRPTIRQVASICIIMLLILRPLWFVIVPLACLALVAALFVVLGAERSWRLLNLLLARMERSNPIRATMWRHRLDRFAYRWDNFLDHFPNGMVDGLYMPDFQWIARTNLHPAVVSPKGLHRYFPWD